MKKILPLLLVLILLAGCAPKEADVSTPETIATEPVGFYAPDSQTELESGGAVRVYPIGSGMITFGILPMGDDLLLLCDQEGIPTLMRLTGDNLYVSAMAAIPDMTYPAIEYFQVDPQGVSYCNEYTRELVLLGQDLRVQQVIDLPEDLTGNPKLSQDRSFLCYGTPEAIKILDLSTGLSRVVYESSEEYKSIDRLLLDGDVAQCSVSDDYETQVLFLDLTSGMVLNARDEYPVVYTQGQQFCATFVDGPSETILYGTAGQQPKMVTLQDYGFSVFPMLRRNALVSAGVDSEGNTNFDYYDLNTGLRTAEITLSGEHYPWYASGDSLGNIYFLQYDDELQQDVISRWTPEMTPAEDETVYIGTYFTADNPDLSGIARCQARADEIAQAAGIRILLWEDIQEFSPWDYDFVPEYKVPVIEAELDMLQEGLGNFPEGFLNRLAEEYESLTICIVREIWGSADRGSLDYANGLQYWDEFVPYIALAAGEPSPQTLYHELFHVIDSYVVTHCSAYDDWDSLNPGSFTYDYDYVANIHREGGEYLDDDATRAFIDEYSMSFPMEDRARIMEYAMEKDNEYLFQSVTMQQKLRQLSLGIREAFRLPSVPGGYLWEQYLLEPIS